MINAFIQGSYVKLDGRKAGVQGESRSKILRLTFSPEWKDLEKSILWQDARGETVVRVPLVPTSAEINEYGGLRIDTKIPGEALAYAGECEFTVTGYDLTDSARTLSAETVMQVEENELAGKEAVNAQDPTPDAVEQLQNAVTKAANDVARFAAAAENSALESRDYMNAATDASLEAEASKEAAASSEREAANWANVAGQCASRSADSLTLVLAAQADVAQDTNEAKTAKVAAETAAEEAKQAAQDAKTAADSVQDVSADAEAAKAAAQAAQAAQKAAEDARDQAQAVAGGDFMNRTTYDPQGKKTDIFKYVDEKLKDYTPGTGDSLPLAGGTMTGPITLAGDPVEDLHAVPKRYVDDTLGYVENELFEVNGGTEGEDDTGSGDGTGGMTYQIGHGLKVEGNTLMVNSVLDFEGDNSLPASASLVQSTVGNIEVLLATI